MSENEIRNEILQRHRPNLFTVVLMCSTRDKPKDDDYVEMEGNATKFYNACSSRTRTCIVDRSVRTVPEGACIAGYAINQVIFDQPSSLTTIQAGAFCILKFLRRIELPEGLERILDRAFYGCTLLEYVNLPSTLIEIGYGAFSQCPNISNIILPSAVAKIGEYAFADFVSHPLKLPSLIESVSSNSFGTVGIGEQIFDLLTARTCRLKTLFFDNEFANEDESDRELSFCFFISAFMENKNTLEELSLNDNNLNDKLIIPLLENLDSKTSMKRIHLRRNQRVSWNRLSEISYKSGNITTFDVDIFPFDQNTNQNEEEAIIQLIHNNIKLCNIPLFSKCTEKIQYKLICNKFGRVLFCNNIHIIKPSVWKLVFARTTLLSRQIPTGCDYGEKTEWVEVNAIFYLIKNGFTYFIPDIDPMSLAHVSKKQKRNVE